MGDFQIVHVQDGEGELILFLPWGFRRNHCEKSVLHSVSDYLESFIIALSFFRK